AASIAYVKERDGIVNPAMETRRLQLALDGVVNTSDARAEGFGQISATRMALMASQVSDVYATKTRVNPDLVWSGRFLPPVADLDVFPKK
ncbi:MAG: taurine ABC transporter permease, partial [Comamonas sp.]